MKEGKKYYKNKTFARKEKFILLSFWIKETLILWISGRWEIREFFWAKKLMERWYLLALFDFSMIFQDFGNMVFLAVVRVALKIKFLGILLGINIRMKFYIKYSENKIAKTIELLIVDILLKGSLYFSQLLAPSLGIPLSTSYPLLKLKLIIYTLTY